VAEEKSSRGSRRIRTTEECLCCLPWGLDACLLATSLPSPKATLNSMTTAKTLRCATDFSRNLGHMELDHCYHSLSFIHSSSPSPPRPTSHSPRVPIHWASRASPRPPRRACPVPLSIAPSLR
jgi:hypothetical protein